MLRTAPLIMETRKKRTKSSKITISVTARPPSNNEDIEQKLRAKFFKIVKCDNKGCLYNFFPLKTCYY